MDDAAVQVYAVAVYARHGNEGVAIDRHASEDFAIPLPFTLGFLAAIKPVYLRGNRLMQIAISGARRHSLEVLQSEIGEGAVPHCRGTFIFPAQLLVAAA